MTPWHTTAKGIVEQEVWRKPSQKPEVHSKHSCFVLGRGILPISHLDMLPLKHN